MAVLERRRRDDPRRGATEAAFLAAAGELLGEGLSFADLSVSVVADRAGRTRTAFYAHFEDRRALLFRLVEPLEADARTAVAEFVDGDGDEGVRASLERLMATLRRHAAVARAVVEAAGYDEQVSRFWAALIGAFAEANRQRLVRAGIPDDRARATAVVLTWMTERCCTQQLSADAALGDDELVDALADTWKRVLSEQGTPRAG